MSKNGEKERTSWWWFALLAAAIVGAWGMFWWVAASAPGFAGWEQRGQFGDMFGALNALFSGLALAGVIFALHLQMRELALQREEMQQSREELARTADAQAEQVRLLARQIEAMEAQIRDAAETRKQQTAPAFKFINAPTTQGVAEIQVENHGALIKRLVALSLGDYQVKLKPSDVLQTGGRLEAKVLFGGPQPDVVRFNLTFEDVDGHRRTMRIESRPQTRFFDAVDVPISDQAERDT